MKQDRQARKENVRLKAALAAIHDALHRNDVNAAHEACECAMEGGVAKQPNLTQLDSAKVQAFIAAFNVMAKQRGLMAACVLLLPSATKPDHVSIQLGGNVVACKLIESGELLRAMGGGSSVYMGEHEDVER